MTGDIEVIYLLAFGWTVRVQGTRQRLYTSRRKVEAAEVGRAEAKERRVELIVKNMLGRISWRNSYGHDPKDIPG